MPTSENRSVWKLSIKLATRAAILAPLKKTAHP
jgi:hypothetical protein